MWVHNTDIAGKSAAELQQGDTFRVFSLHTVTGASDLCSCTWMGASVLRAHPLKLCFCTVSAGIRWAMQLWLFTCIRARLHDELPTLH